MRSLLPGFLSLLVVAGLPAEIRLPALFGDHMVLQRDRPVHVWGWADAGETVTVEFLGQTASDVAGESGRWEVYLEPAIAGGPHELLVAGSNSIRLEDVQVGEVWVASGQSNMVWPVARSMNAEEEAAAAMHPAIRYFKVGLDTAASPRDDVEGNWQVVSPETAGELSGVAYFFARHLRERMDVPFGIIQSAWGGTPAEAWTGLQAMGEHAQLVGLVTGIARAAAEARPGHEAALADWREQAAEAKANGTDPPRQPRSPRSLQDHHQPGALFNAMVEPLTPYAIRGVIWYQGENNAGRGQGVLYRQLFRTLIEDWRRAWALGPLPFLFVQLANYGRVPETSTWPELREAQAMALGLAHTGMAVTIDIGNPTDIHPRNKQEVGRRLALAARAVAYGERDVQHSGPLFRQATQGDGGTVRLWFEHAGGGLQARGGALEGFEVAGPDGAFVAAEARIHGHTVVVSSPEVSEPLHVRYAWAADPPGNLVNGAGLPAAPFRTSR